MSNPMKDLVDYDLDVADERLGLDELLNTVMPEYRPFWKSYVCKLTKETGETSRKLLHDCSGVGQSKDTPECPEKLQSALCGSGGKCIMSPSAAGTPGESYFFCKCHKGYATSSHGAFPMCDVRVDYKEEIELRKAALSDDPSGRPGSLGSPTLTAGLIGGFVVMLFLLIGCLWIMFIKKYNKVFPSPLFSKRVAASPLSASKYSLSPSSTPGHDYRITSTRSSDSFPSGREDNRESPFGATSLSDINLGCEHPVTPGVDGAFTPGGFGLKQRSPAINSSSTPRITVHKNNNGSHRSKIQDDSHFQHRSRSFRFPSIKEEEEDTSGVLGNCRHARFGESPHRDFEDYLDYVITEQDSIQTPLLEACVDDRRKDGRRDVHFWDMSAPGMISAISETNSPTKDHDA